MLPPSDTNDRSLSSNRGLLSRHGPLLLAAMILLLIYGALFTWPQTWNHVMWKVLHKTEYYPFHDMRGHLASGEAYAAGMDVLGKRNPLDLAGRPHLGTTWMLYTGLLGLNTSHFLLASWICIALFFATTLAFWRPSSYAEAGLLCLCLASGPTLLLIHQANVDLFIYVCLVAAMYLIAKDGHWPKAAGLLIISCFIGFKYFPNMAFAAFLVASLKLRTKVNYLLVAGLLIGAYLLFFWQEITHVAAMVAPLSHPNWYGAGRLVSLSGISEDWVGLASLTGFSLATLLMCRLLGPLQALEKVEGFHTLLFVMGAGITWFCFAVTTSAEYRLVFLVPCFPALLNLYKGARGRLRLATLSVPLLLIVLPWAVLLVGQTWQPMPSYSFLYKAVVIKQIGNWIGTSLLGALWLRTLWAHNKEAFGFPASCR